MFFSGSFAFALQQSKATQCSAKPLQGKVAIVTGSSEGVGAGIALQLAMNGADVCVNYVGPPSLAEETAAEVRKQGSRCITVHADVSDEAAVGAMFDQIQRELGAVDILVTSAILSKRNDIFDTKVEEFRRTLDVGVTGVFLCMQAAARQMVAAGKKGSFVHITSPHYDWPAKGCIDYNTAKAASHHLALSVANELMWKGIRVNFVEPGWTETAGEIRLYGKKQLDENGKKMPLGRLGRPSDTAKAVCWLCTDDAAFVVGTHIVADGGMFIEGGQSWNVPPRDR
jgi:NAD(P)-dependent dehydrogenase (short-subunit alcohol dehydrogenase family)